MKKIIVCVIALVMLSNVCEAKRRKYYTTSSYTSMKYSAVDNSSAQGVANTMAERNYVSHFGGHPGLYEGCGSGWSQEQAYRNCCYSNSGMPVVDVGYAQSKNGMWYCCKRYSRR